MSQVKREVWVVENANGGPESAFVFCSQADDDSYTGRGERVVRYAPAPKKRKRRRKR